MIVIQLTVQSQGLEETMQKDFQVLKRLCQECQERREVE
jgi:hypothetical protein